MFDYAKKIREYRERKCLTQEELAKILNVSYVSVCRWVKVYSDNLDYPQFKKWLNKAVGADGEDLSRNNKWLSIVIMHIEY